MVAHYTWWSSLDLKLLNCKKITIKTLNQVIGLFACERNLSTFDFIANDDID
jgi:hypothetical protein